uniref:MHC class I-like antigen recognition-like domain-containing protein n=1 Tax=Neogobius melanostomus TaxID=47308 RepID=A0A8C6TKX3_9GOBI
LKLQAHVCFGLKCSFSSTVTHSLMYFDTSSTQVPNFPQYVAVGYVNGLQITHYDSKTRKYEPKQEWMKRITEEDHEYWDRQTQRNLNAEQVYKVNTETVNRLHIHQWMIGCEWDDETNEINGYYQTAFDGEDFIALDLKTETFVAPRPEAVVTKHKWERIGEAVRAKDYITHECVDDLKKYLRNGESVLMRKELPLVSFLQKSPSSPVTCHATDGEELYEGVDYWEILPNHDGTFQKSADLDLTSVPHQDWERYECVFQLSGVPDKNYRLERSKIRTNGEDASFPQIRKCFSFILVKSLLNAKQRLNSDNQETPSERCKTDLNVL